MKNTQQKLNMHRALAVFCFECRRQFRPFPEFELSWRCYRAILSSIDALCLQEQQLARGRNIHAAEERRIICAQAADIASMVEVYAEHAQHKELKEKVSHQFRSLMRCEDKRLVRYCRDIHAAGVQYNAVMEQYGLTRQVFDVLAGTIELFNAVVPPPKNAALLKKEYHERFAFFMQQLNSILKKMDAGAKGFMPLNPDLYHGYIQRRKPGKGSLVRAA